MPGVIKVEGHEALDRRSMGAQYSLGEVPEELEKFSRFSKLEALYRKYLKLTKAAQNDDPGHFIRCAGTTAY